MAENKINNTRRLTETAIMIAVATVLSYFAPFTAPMGGSITLFSQVPIVIIGYRYGFKWGAFTGMLHGILQMLLQGLGNFAYVKGFAAYLILIFFDYVLAFMMLGIGGSLFKKAIKYQTVALAFGAAVASLLRFLCHFISGVTIWGEYADGWKSVWVYSLGYNGFYMLFEGIITVVGVIVLSLILDFNKPNLRKRKAVAESSEDNEAASDTNK